MPWKVTTYMSERHALINAARQEGTNIAKLCREYEISRKTLYKWLKRANENKDEDFTNRSRRPINSPKKTDSIIEEQVLLSRKEYHWGGRKIHQLLINEGYSSVPAASTITDILRRNNKLDEQECLKHKPFSRFERENPNELWQMDFKGEFKTFNGLCYPLTITDDCTRFNICLNAYHNYTRMTVQSALTDCFRKYGMPDAILSDNGSPWGNTTDGSLTRLTVWMIRLGIAVKHGRFYHPQTQGKEERFHRTLKFELISRRSFTDLVDCQQAFDAWREVYNTKRPHEALSMEVPANRYTPSERIFPETLPMIDYDEDLSIRKVMCGGLISFNGYEIRVGRAFLGEYVALQRTSDDRIYTVLFSTHEVGKIDLSKYDKTKYNAMMAK